MSGWLAAQCLVAALWLLAELLVRRGDPAGGRTLRWLALAAVVGWWLPLPSLWREQAAQAPVFAAVERLVPLSVGVDSPLAAASSAPIAPGFDLAWVPLAAGLVVAGLLLLHILRSARLLRHARPVHTTRTRFGRLTIARVAHGTPCTLWLGRHWVLLDDATWRDPHARQLALRHELTHIRHGDPLAAWISALALLPCALNPFAWLLLRRLRELDELAVDAALLRSGTVSARSYGQLLLRTATRSPQPRLAVGLSHRAAFLHRRLSMLKRPARRPHPVFARWSFAAGALLIGAAAIAHPGDHPHPLPASADGTAQEAVRNDISAPRGIDVPDHPIVDRALARYREGGAHSFAQRALARRPQQVDAIHTALQAAGLPTALEAVVFVESGYDTQAITSMAADAPYLEHPKAAGLWQFIPQTATTYGLRVDGEVDERLDVTRETEAAVALLSDLHDEFGDWGLALAAYNQGPAHVRRAIANEGTRDVPSLVERGALNRYVPMFWAALRLLEEG